MSHLALARALKASIARPAGPAAPPRDQWFTRNQTISYTHVSKAADDEYEAFFNMDPRIAVAATDNFSQWIETVSEEELAEKLSVVPWGLAGTPELRFTPWQMANILKVVQSPCDETVKIHVSTEALHDLANYAPGEKKRKEPFGGEFSVREGSFLNINLLNAPTGCGKTASALAVAAMGLMARYEDIVGSYRAAKVNTIFQGVPTFPVARLAIVAAPAQTFDHFQSTLERLIPVLQEMDRGLVFHVWTTQGKYKSTRVAADLPHNHVVFWIVPMEKLTAVLRAHPEVAVPILIADELNDPPREKWTSQKSEVLKLLICQATPAALVKATYGRNILSEFFGGDLHPPQRISALIGRRSFKEAQRAIEQACLLHLMSVGHRDEVRLDLERLVPPCLQVVVIRSRKITLTSLIHGHPVDLIPADLKMCIMSMVRPYHPTPQSVAAFHGAMAAAITPEQVIQAVQMLQAEFTGHNERLQTVVRRIVEKTRSFEENCPICMEECTDFRICSTCGFVVCAGCYIACRDRCGYCRAPFRRNFQPEEVMQPPRPREPEYPALTSLDLVADSWEETLRIQTSPSNNQKYNLCFALRVLLEHGKKRFLLLIDRGVSVADIPLDFVHGVSAATGVAIAFANISGKGTEFKKTKTRFDDAASGPMAIACWSDSDILYGTDLTCCDALVCVGNVPDRIATQALGRVFRPGVERGPIPFAKIIC
jgi:hypothetical protein